MDNIVNSFVTLAATGAGGASSIILIVLMIALMYFFMIRPQQKQRKQHQEMMNELHKGDEVVTIGRLHGKIDEVNKENRTVTLDCEGIYLTFDMVAIARVLKRAGEDEQPNQQAAEPQASADKDDAVEAATTDDTAAAKAADDDAESK